MEFLKDIIGTKKQYFLQQQIVTIRVPMCPELTVEKVLKQVKVHKQMMDYLPGLTENGKQYIERDFMFGIVNTIDRNYFREALAEIEVRRTNKAVKGEEGLIEIDEQIFCLLEQVQSRMSAQKLSASKRTMYSLTGLGKRRKPIVRLPVESLTVTMKPQPKLDVD